MEHVLFAGLMDKRDSTSDSPIEELNATITGSLSSLRAPQFYKHSSTIKLDVWRLEIRIKQHDEEKLASNANSVEEDSSTKAFW